MGTLLKVTALAACLTAFVPAAAGAQSCPNPRDGTHRAAARSAIMCLVNAQRTSRGLHALRAQRKLGTAAARYARRMVRNDFFAHNRRSLIRRVRRTGYMRHHPRWRVGENLAWGNRAASRPSRIVNAWMASPPHRRNILDRRFREIGIGIVAGAPVAGATGITFVADFGVRRR